jgi:hypothetical protein
MWFLMNLVDLSKADSRAYGGSSIIRQFYQAMVSEDVFEKACRSFALEIYNGFLEGSGADFIVDKSPRYYYMLEWLDRLFPQSRRIHLQRNPLSVAASFKKVNRHTGEGFDLIQSLNHSKLNMKAVDLTLGLTRLNDYFAEAHPLAYELKYEQLVMKPQEELEKLCAFLGITYEQGMERYGQFVDSTKADMFYSMGVGDPFLSSHQEAHQDSVNNWKNILERREVELYCRVLGANLFHRMGYSEQLQEAEDWTGVQFQAEPDAEILERLKQQLVLATECRWQPNYRMEAPMNGDKDWSPASSGSEGHETAKMDPAQTVTGSSSRSGSAAGTWVYGAGTIEETAARCPQQIAANQIMDTIWSSN